MAVPRILTAALRLRGGRSAGARLVAGALLSFLLPAGAAGAAETDQYLAWGVDLEDSATAVNAFVNDTIEGVLARLNRRRRSLACEQVPKRIYRYLFNGIHSSRVRHFAKHEAVVDLFPDREVGYWQYLERSVFRHPVFPFILPLGRTLRIDSVHLGVDKLNHLFGFGRRYYARYLRARKRGLSEEEAMRRVVLWGFRIERLLVGGVVDGIVSHADLEANFQGMRLARDLCEADPPYLASSDGGWKLARPVDLRDYVNPNFDESFNNSHFTRPRWNVVRPVLVEEYCPRYLSLPVQRRFAGYREADAGSFSRAVIRDYFRRRGRDPQREQSLGALCTASPAAVSSAR